MPLTGPANNGACATKSKILTVGEQKSSNQPFIMLQSQPLKEVESFPYLGGEIGQSMVWNQKCQQD